ncbi:Protein FANTASTIC FOUR like [Actinidia chinensis var. chinensis]|uniref:Protein FANTASTIC FOUR like n=1 Tax=Actinidia chinensis var. chinensis TaxID=1590841 RepID=A0A2R6P534_ACTCC|nr:Protein FANTASTIC FOUR like [Actinidia chinensis var. chinensis]
MSTVVFQQLNSLGSQLKETRTLSLKFKSNNGETNHNSSNPNMGNWNFLQSLSNTSQNPKSSSYSHPMANQTSPKLTTKSLEMCTENLGSETGSDTTEITDFSLSSLELDRVEDPTTGAQNLRQNLKSRKLMDSPRNFPPPLTTISGTSAMLVQTHREGGRVIIQAVEATSWPVTCLRAERSDGRLRLCFLKDCCDIEEVENEANEEEEEEDDFEEEEESEEESGVCEREDMKGNSLDGGGKMGMENFRRVEACKFVGYGNRRLCNWGAFGVATS